MAARDTITRVITDVARAHGKTLPPLTDDLSVLDSGLDSFCLAVILATLHDKLGVDPFSAADGDTMPVTVGEFVTFYEDALV